MQTFSWQTRDQLRIHGLYWPVDNPVAIVGIVHGLGEHAGRYQHLARWLNDKQVAVVAYDRRGHGQSEGRRGHTPTFDLLLDEIAQLLVAMEMRAPEAPAFLYGHSMGGNLLLNYLIQRRPKLAGAIVTGPHIRLAFQPSAIQVALGKAMRGIFPTFTQGNGLDVQQISRDKTVVTAYINDLLVHDRLTAALGIGMLEGATRLDHYAGPIAAPLLLMHGGADGITSAQATQDFAARVQGNVSCRIWDGLYHEIHNEPEQLQVFQYVWAWMQERM
jgi:alpha-beta hydrolase superfamily lysophospholipase